jgi:hypothetical protein
MHESTFRLVDRALASPTGARCLEKVERRLQETLEQGRFNAQCAVDLYTFGIDDAVWADLEGNALRRIIYRNYVLSREGSTRAAQLAQAFVARTRAVDQRPARRWLPRFAWGP